mgnify:CR=1 FL=1
MMTSATPAILIADDDADVLAALNLALKSEGYRVTTATSPQEALLILERKSFSCLLIDLNYRQDTTSGEEGKTLIQAVRQRDATLPIIALTGFGSIELAVDVMKLGANDFIEKPWRNAQLLTCVKQQVEHFKALKSNQKLAEENHLLRNNDKKTYIAESAVMQSLLTQIERIAKSDMNVLLTGENGTGKSLLASYLHQHSMRQNGSFLAVNMGSITESLFESEMFGHVKGAFTDAKQDRIGRFELAAEGTLFLDEIANINLTQQAKLLHVLEERQFERVGSHITQEADVRLISATNANLHDMVAQGQFRQDLLYRLNTVELRVPSLKERLDDILPLARHFLTALGQKYRMPEKTLSNDAIEFLLNYDWPGNVRELGHTMERALFLSTDDEISAGHLNLPAAPNHLPRDCERTLEDIEKAVILERQQRFDKDPSRTAHSLGLSRSAYYRRLDKFQLNA